MASPSFHSGGTRVVSIPESVVVSPGIEAARVRVPLVLAVVVLDDVHGGTLLHVHALVGAGNELVAGDEVIAADVFPVGPLKNE